jgi:Zn-dependent M16 (insulinase) family peptidase
VDRALEHCKALTEGDWANMLNEYVIRRPYVAVIGRPSAALGDQMREDEKARVDAQRASLGDEALAVCIVATGAKRHAARARVTCSRAARPVKASCRPGV